MKITIINTGGTFNKVYNPISGELDISNDNKSIEKIISYCHNIEFEIQNIISKDSLDIDDKDRQEIVDNILQTNNENIVVIHGTDTMDLSAKFVDSKVSNKKVVFTGAMIPMSIDEVEATMNFSQALGFFNADVKNGVYISMHGIVENYTKLIKNRSQGRFIIS